MQKSLFTVAKLDDFVPADHPLRSLRLLVNEALAGMNERFNAIYADTGRDSIAPEKPVRALLLQVFYSIRSERQLCEQLNYNLLFRWFVGLAIDDAVWNHSVFSKNRDRLLEQAVVDEFFAEVLCLADQRGLLSKEHFSVDGTLIQAWASLDRTTTVRVVADATPKPTGRVSRAPTTHTRAPAIPMPASTARTTTLPRYSASLLRNELDYRHSTVRRSLRLGHVNVKKVSRER
jgi:transposase